MGAFTHLQDHHSAPQHSDPAVGAAGTHDESAARARAQMRAMREAADENGEVTTSKETTPSRISDARSSPANAAPPYGSRHPGLPHSARGHVGPHIGAQVDGYGPAPTSLMPNSHLGTYGVELAKQLWYRADAGLMVWLRWTDVFAGQIIFI